MKNNWKSSENPLYVKVIWKKDERHVILFNEKPRNKAQFFKNSCKIRNNNEFLSLVESDLENCLTKTKLRSPETRIADGIAAYKPLFVQPIQQICKITNYTNLANICNINRSYYCVDISATSSSSAKYKSAIKNHRHSDSFIERVVHWLNTTNTLNICDNDISVDNKKTKQTVKMLLCRRPKTSLAYVKSPFFSKMSNGKKKNSFVLLEDSFTQMKRPQLHVFMPFFHNNLLI